MEGAHPKSEVKFAMVWNKVVPFKASTMAWRLMWDRLPTKDNLFKQKVIRSLDAAKCSGCGAATESADHFFLECPISKSV